MQVGKTLTAKALFTVLWMHKQAPEESPQQMKYLT